jgi:hypothetical protein
MFCSFVTLADDDADAGTRVSARTVAFVSTSTLAASAAAAATGGRPLALTHSPAKCCSTSGFVAPARANNPSGTPYGTTRGWVFHNFFNFSCMLRTFAHSQLFANKL